MQNDQFRNYSLATLATIAVFAALYLAKDFFAPVLAALVLGIVCSPLVDRVCRSGVPRIAAALLVLLALLVSVFLLFFFTEPTISKAIRNAPVIWREMTEVVATLRSAFQGLEDLQTAFADALSAPETSVEAEEESAPVEVPGALDALALAPTVAASFFIFIGTLYFFLVSRDELYAQADRMKGRLTATLLCEAEARVSHYFLTITVIYAVFGVLVGVAMSLIGLPNPVLWGLAAFLLNFVLYLGPAVIALALTITGIVVFDGPYSFLPAVTYVAMNMTEGQFVTPSLIGQHMAMSPLLVFVSLVFWLWMWGPIGGVVAIPILVWTTFVSAHLLGKEPEIDPQKDAYPTAAE